MPDQTLDALEVKLPQQCWTEIDRLLIRFGKHIETAQHPRCSTCPVHGFCARLGVKGPG
jgi:endonuclease-3